MGNPKSDSPVRRVPLAKTEGIERNEYTQACGTLRAGVGAFLSIDNYLHSHSQDRRIVAAGKIAIARSILAAEARSVLYIKRNQGDRFSLDKIANSWLLPFIKMLNANVNKNEIKDIFSNLSIICFNYDRCIEHALHELIQISFGVDASTATECMQQLAIIHPYGVVGGLPWQSHAASVGFGDFERRDLEALAENISLFTEQKTDEAFNEFIDNHVTSAQQIVFMGFGYYRQNMELITRRPGQIEKIVGTATGLSAADISTIRNDIRERFQIHGQTQLDPVLENMTCTTFMNAYQRTPGAV